jgi:hypothetical protein
VPLDTHAASKVVSKQKVSNSLRLLAGFVHAHNNMDHDNNTVPKLNINVYGQSHLSCVCYDSEKHCND